MNTLSLQWQWIYREIISNNSLLYLYQSYWPGIKTQILRDAFWQVNTITLFFQIPVTYIVHPFSCHTRTHHTCTQTYRFTVRGNGGHDNKATIPLCPVSFFHLHLYNNTICASKRSCLQNKKKKNRFNKKKRQINHFLLKTRVTADTTNRS